MVICPEKSVVQGITRLLNPLLPYIYTLMSIEQRVKRLFNNRILTHVLFWVGYLLFYSLIYGSYKDEYGRELFIQLIYLPARIVLTYFTLYFLLPKYLLPGRWINFLIIFMVSALVCGIMQRMVTYYVEYPIYYPNFQKEYPLLLPIKILKSMLGIYPVALMALAVKLLKYWYINQQDRQVLVNEKLEAELKFLKTQIHPHFLFNTLNNLYALTLKKSDQAPEMVLKLSELINYMLYECNANKVPLDKEISFVRNYIEVEKMRHGSKLEVNLSVNGNTQDVYIAPMIILPFLENSFKHGVNEELETSWISLQISIATESKHDKFVLKVENTRSETQNLLKNGNGEGIGLNNVRRRLDLLYKENYTLNTYKEQDLYLVILEIHLIK